MTKTVALIHGNAVFCRDDWKRDFESLTDAVLSVYHYPHDLVVEDTSKERSNPDLQELMILSHDIYLLDDDHRNPTLNPGRSEVWYSQAIKQHHPESKVILLSYLFLTPRHIASRGADFGIRLAPTEDMITEIVNELYGRKLVNRR